MTLTEIERALRELRLSGIAATLNTRVMQAQSSQEPFLDTFASMLQHELDHRRSCLTERRFKQSGLDELLSLVRGQGSAALIATHNIALAAKMDRVVTLHEGRLA